MNLKNVLYGSLMRPISFPSAFFFFVTANMEKYLYHATTSCKSFNGHSQNKYSIEVLLNKSGPNLLKERLTFSKMIDVIKLQLVSWNILYM